MLSLYICSIYYILYSFCYILINYENNCTYTQTQTQTQTQTYIAEQIAGGSHPSNKKQQFDAKKNDNGTYTFTCLYHDKPLRAFPAKGVVGTGPVQDGRKKWILQPRGNGGQDDKLTVQMQNKKSDEFIGALRLNVSDLARLVNVGRDIDILILTD